MSDQPNQQNENAEVLAHNAVNHALRELNDAHSGSGDRREAMQAAQEHLDQARLQLEQARHADKD